MNMVGTSLHIGLNHVSPTHYGSDQPLRSAVADALAMQKIADNAGFSSRILTDSQATAGGIAKEISLQAQQLKSGDIFFVSYAGHGAQLFDGSGDEPDSLDETWCSFDRMILDDELFGLYAGFKHGVRILVISDSCHSGSVARMVDFSDQDCLVADGPPMPEDPLIRFRTLDQETARAVYLDNQNRYDEIRAFSAVDGRATLSCSLQLLAACQDNQLAADGPNNGYFTSQMLYHWANGSFPGSYTELFQKLEAAMPRRQKPARQILGEQNADFLNQRPFTL
jgi:hypothetical protein